MPAHVTPRNLLGDARIDLDAQLEDLQAIVKAMDGLDSASQALRAEVLRRCASLNRSRHQADEAIDHVQRLHADAWDGRERRQKDRRAARLEVQAAHAEMAAAA